MSSAAQDQQWDDDMETPDHEIAHLPAISQQRKKAASPQACMTGWTTRSSLQVLYFHFSFDDQMASSLVPIQTLNGQYQPRQSFLTSKRKTPRVQAVRGVRLQYFRTGWIRIRKIGTTNHVNQYAYWAVVADWTWFRMPYLNALARKMSISGPVPSNGCHHPR